MLEQVRSVAAARHTSRSRAGSLSGDTCPPRPSAPPQQPHPATAVAGAAHQDLDATQPCWCEAAGGCVMRGRQAGSQPVDVASRGSGHGSPQRAAGQGLAGATEPQRHRPGPAMLAPNRPTTRMRYLLPVPVARPRRAPAQTARRSWHNINYDFKHRKCFHHNQTFNHDSTSNFA
jgi:hypothetical protein